MALLEEFQEVLQRTGGRLVGDAYYGVWERFPFTAYIEKLRGAGVVSFDFRLGVPLPKARLQELRRALPRGCRLTAEAGLRFRLLCRGRTLQKQRDGSLGQILGLFASGLEGAGISPPERCPLCGQTGCDAYADLGGYTSAHRRCVEAMARSGRSRAEKAARSGSYATGFLGALLGGLLVSLAMLGLYALGMSAGTWGYVLLPCVAYTGYRLCRGRMNRGAFLFSCAASVLWLLLLEQAFFYISLHVRYDIWPSVLDTFLYYWRRKTVGEVFSDMWMPAALVLIGFLLNWRLQIRTTGTDLEAANRILATLTGGQAEEV